jgi:fructose-bisphosphate aldolase class II
MSLASAKEMLRKAQKGRYAVGHFNLNNLESVRAFLLAAQEMESPIILGVSGGTAKYMGGYKTITGMVEPFMDFLHITVPVALHVDHGTFEEALAAIDGDFSSVMFDGSKFPIAENIEKTKIVVERCRDRGISVEAEVGAIGGQEDGRIAMGECADPQECKLIADLGVDMLAAGIGNIHGKYPPGWKGLNFDVLDAVHRLTGELPLVLHGGSGIPDGMVRKAIILGISKVNVNTECQIAFTQATRRFIEAGRDLMGNGFTTRALLADGLEATKAKCIEKIKLFGSAGMA